MDTVTLKLPNRQILSLNFSKLSEVEALFSHIAIPHKDCYIVCNGRIVPLHNKLQAGCVYNVAPRLIAGKGGFGSMLRALGAQIEKTTNREACRDLSGRRMRDINNEKQLKEWVDKKADREQEREKRREERREKRLQFLAGTKHNFDDPNYHQQKMEVSERLENALQQGLQKSTSDGPSTSGTCASNRKRKTDSQTSSSAAKKACEWLGIEDLSDFDSSSDSDDSAMPEPSSVSVAPSITSVHPDHHTGIADSDSGVESVNQVKSTSGNSPMDVDLDSDGGAKNVSDREDGKIEETKSSGLLALLPPPKAAAVPHSIEPVEIDLLAYDSQSALEHLGLDTLKAVLMARALKCGGTLHQRAERLWSVRGKTQDQIDPSLFAKSTKTKSKGKGK